MNREDYDGEWVSINRTGMMTSDKSIQILVTCAVSTVNGLATNQAAN